MGAVLAHTFMINFYKARDNMEQNKLPLAPADHEQLDVATLETWLWDAACAIRRAVAPPAER
jgi:hypothetical protein